MSIVVEYSKEGIAVINVPKTIVFSAGEVHPNLPLVADVTSFHVRADIKNSQDLMELMLVSEILNRQYPDAVRYLTLPYLPYSRQDRECAPGDAISLKVFGDMLNICGYDTVYTYDIHNSVAASTYIDNLCSFSQTLLALGWNEFMYRVNGLKPRGVVVVSPDSGAQEKSWQMALNLGVSLLRGVKKIDPLTGNITGVDVESGESCSGFDVLICDDICDGGRTFIELAKVLKVKYGARKVILYVTHGILSKGCKEINQWIDEMYIYNYIGSEPVEGNIYVRSKE